MTHEQKVLSRKFLIYKFVMNLWFVEAIWLYFYRVFMTDGQVGTLDSVAFLIGLLVEVPSGALADKFGRARIAKIGVI
jgi:MFS family permease